MKKIMFNDAYAQTARVLSGEKTQTRRIIPKSFFSLMWDERDDTLVYENDFGDGIDIRRSVFAKYDVGEVVAVAQSYGSILDELESLNNCTCMEAWENDAPKRTDYSELMHNPGFRNKMFVSADLMPHRIRITNVRVERLQDISDEDCAKEGISYIMDAPFFLYGVHCDTGMICLGDTPREAYAELIDKISGKGTWESNPYVFVYDFELIC